MKLILGVTVIFMDNYFGLRHREKIICEWLKFTSGRKEQFYVHYYPRLDDKIMMSDKSIPIEIYPIEQIISTPKEKNNMRHLEDWQNNLIDELLATTVMPKEIAKSAEVSQVTIYKRLKALRKEESRPDLSGDVKEKTIRPIAQYSNHNNIQQYFD